MVGCPSVRPSVCPVDRQTSDLLVVCCRRRARAADIDPQLPAPRPSISAGARAAAAGSVMLRAEVRGSTQTWREFR